MHVADITCVGFTIATAYKSAKIKIFAAFLAQNVIGIGGRVHGTPSGITNRRVRQS